MTTLINLSFCKQCLSLRNTIPVIGLSFGEVLDWRFLLCTPCHLLRFGHDVLWARCCEIGPKVLSHSLLASHPLHGIEYTCMANFHRASVTPHRNELRAPLFQGRRR
ncbi:hypothetical protein VNO77_37715 [Canavalia gladiata]|uniref:Uncharacterized protein n=1 Tax=Canavalia gladiata TaxID=3824 RepID=A0AAN9K937_CANGL